MHVLITGGAGLIGQALIDLLLAAGHEVTVLSRNPERHASHVPPNVRLAQWDATTSAGWGSLVEESDAIINLAGEGLADRRWTAEQKRRIHDSRVAAGNAVVEAIRTAVRKPQVLIQASAVGYYGPRKDEIVTEDSGPGSDFLAKVCFDWEASTAPVERLGVRRAVMRTGIVLTLKGGAFPRALLPFRLFAGGPLGSGDQWWPWIHLDDEVRAIQFLLENSKASGPYNLTAPNPVTNREFARTLGSVASRPSFVPAPAFAIKPVLGEMATVVLDGQRAIPRRLQEQDFTFTYSTLESALRALLK
jgi:uncharacterized protein (TIGR01777 family)